ncbi:hypothetical protein Tdes44962_MAKER06061, partial [Teratosphaeria destructans]
LGISEAITSEHSNPSWLRYNITIFQPRTTHANRTKMSLSVINLPVPVSKFEPKRFNLEDEFRLIQARCEQSTIKQGSYGKGKLYSKELLHVQQVAFETAVSGSKSPLLPFIYKVGKDRCLVQFNEKTQAGIEGVVGKSYSALVVAWEGRGFPPSGLDEHLEDQDVAAEESADEAMDDGDLYDILCRRQNGIVQWKRFGHEDNRHHTGLRFRWTRVELYPYTDKFNSHNHLQHLTDELEGVDVHNVQLYHVKVNIHEIAKATLPQLIYQVVDNTHMNERYFALSSARNTKTATWSYTRRNSTTWLKTDAGMSRMCSLYKAQNTTCYKLFMYNGLASDLLLGYFGVPATKYDSTYHKYITKALRGRIVKISGRGERRTIFAISEHDASKVSDADKHDAWLRRKDRLVEHPKLFCLDLGSQGKPALIPPELCVIEPHQSFTGKQTQSLQRELSRLQQDLILPSEEVSENAYIEEFSPRQRKITELDKELCDAFPDGVTFLFVEAGVNKLPNTAWAAFRQALKENQIFKRRDMVVSAEAPIFLKYQLEAHSDDTQATKAAWKAQLLHLMNKQDDGVQDKGKKPAAIVVASIQDDQHNRDIYHMLKYITECEVGLQSFAVNLANVNRLAKKFQNDGGRKVANEVINRMRIRNPPDSPKADRKDIAVALHIERKLVDHLQISDQGLFGASRWVYLVVLSSRGFETGTDYRTKVHKLMSQSEMDQYNPADHVLDFVKQVLPSNSSDYEHRITILRTGFMPPISSPPVSMHPGRKAEAHVHFDARYIRLQCDDGEGDDASKEGVNMDAAKQAEQDQKSPSQGSSNYFNHSSNNVLGKQAYGHPVEGSRAETANREMGHIYSKLLEDNRTAKAKVSYILLSEDRDFKLTQEAKERIAKRCLDRVEDKDDGKGGRRAKAVFLIADTKLMNNDHTFGIHRNAASGNATLVKAELLGEKLSDEQEQPKEPDPDEALGRTKKKTSEATEEEDRYEHWRKMLHQHTTRGMLDEHKKRMTPEDHERRQLLQPPPNFGHQLQVRQRPSSSSLASSETTASSVPQHDSAYGSPTKSLRSKTSKLALTSTHDKDDRGGEEDCNHGCRAQTPARLWMDDRMELYYTKWPVPTHLAHLAAKRAWMHLRKDDWEDPDNGTAPLVLVPVKEDVARSLYYL